MADLRKFLPVKLCDLKVLHWKSKCLFIGKRLEDDGLRKPKKHAPSPSKFNFDREAMVAEVNAMPDGSDVCLIIDLILIDFCFDIYYHSLYFITNLSSEFTPNSEVSLYIIYQNFRLITVDLVRNMG